jgi:hypothetical protein
MAADDVAMAAFHVERKPFIVEGVVLPELSMVLDVTVKLAARRLLSMIDWQ